MTEKRWEIRAFEGNMMGICLYYYKNMTSSKLAGKRKIAPFSGAVIGYSVDGEAPDTQTVKEE